ncbi:MAG: MarR family transcriptional regulator [Planctomycetota bacterium]
MHDRQEKNRAHRASELIRCGRAIHSLLDQIDHEMEESLGINSSDLRCLNQLEDHPLTPTELGRSLGLTSGSVTALIDRLSSRGLVKREQSSTDRRSSIVQMEAHAFAHLGSRYRLVAESLAEEFGELSDEEHEVAIGHLEVLIRAFERGLARVRQFESA